MGVVRMAGFGGCGGLNRGFGLNLFRSDARCETQPLDSPVESVRGGRHDLRPQWALPRRSRTPGGPLSPPQNPSPTNDRHDQGLHPLPRPRVCRLRSARRTRSTGPMAPKSERVSCARASISSRLSTKRVARDRAGAPIRSARSCWVTRRTPIAAATLAKDAGLFLNTARELIKSNKSRGTRSWRRWATCEASKISYGYGEDATGCSDPCGADRRRCPTPGSRRVGTAPSSTSTWGTVTRPRPRPRPDKYFNQATTSGWPSGFAHDAEFYQIIAAKVGGEADPASAPAASAKA